VFEIIYLNSLLKPTASSNKRTAHHGNAPLPNDRLFAWVTEDIAKDKSLNYPI
jgi:hypothetical protein